MAFKWIDYLTLAEEMLSKKPSDEAALRTVVSRAYYSVYKEAKKFLEAEGIPISEGEGSHDKVWKTFERSGNKTWKAVSSKGTNLKRRRVWADYELNPSPGGGKPVKWDNEASQAIHDSKNINHWLSQLTQAINAQS